MASAQAFFDLLDRTPTIDNSSTEGQQLVRTYQHKIRHFLCNLIIVNSYIVIYVG